MRRASLTATSGSAPVRPRPRGSSSRRRNAGRTSRSTTSRSSSNCCARATRRPGLVEHHRRAVEHELVLAADQVHVEHRHRRVGGAGREHRLALVDAPGVVRRRVDVDDELGAPGGLRADRPVRAPGVLADRTADAHAGDHEQRPVDGRRREVALLVEHRVVRQEVLAVDALHARRARRPPPRWRGRGRASGNPTTAAMRPVRAASFSSASALRATNAGRSRRSSGG